MTAMTATTAFVLVPGLHTGGWVWDEVAARLREAGAEAYPLTLTGMGGKPEDTADLAAHVADVLHAVEATDAHEVVLVGHCYGVHPVVAAADRRPDRVSRIVLVDTPMPMDGDPAAALVPQQDLRARLLRRIATEGQPSQPSQPAADGANDPEGPEPPSFEEAGAAGGLVPPAAGGWGGYGSLDGVGPGDVRLLERRAVAQPWGTLARPLRLTGNAGAAGAVPVTGVLCAGNGSSLAMVERALGLGDPQLRYLAAPHMSYLEMATGHWPMLADPEATAGVLLRAATGEGAVPRVPSAGQPPTHLRPFLLDVPECPRERIGPMDLHLPAGGEGPYPAVVFVHGGPVPEGARPTPRDWPTFVGYARLAAGLGAVGVTVDHRLHDLADFGRAARDVEEAVALVRTHPAVDADRVALWFFSTGGLLSADWLAEPPPWLRCLALSYPLLAPLPGWGVEPRFHPARTVRAAGRLPVVLTRVGRERPEFAATVEDFRTAAEAAAVDVQLVDVPSAPHGFETLDDPGEAREAVTLAARSVVAHLGLSRQALPVRLAGPRLFAEGEGRGGA